MALKGLGNCIIHRPNTPAAAASCDTALGIWNCIQKLYDDRGLYRKIALLSGLLSNKLSESDGMQDYVLKIASAANKLQEIGFAVNDEWLGAILFSGLTEEFIMGLEANGVVMVKVTVYLLEKNQIIKSGKTNNECL